MALSAVHTCLLLAYFEVRTVSDCEVDLVRPTHDNGWLRPQIEAKLARLHPACPDHRELRRLVSVSLGIALRRGRQTVRSGPGLAVD